MDDDSDSHLGESSRSSTFGHICDSSAANNSPLLVLSATCALCHRILSSDSETGDLEAISVCGDCKFLLLEDIETTSPDTHQMRIPASRRRYSSSESIESMFSQQFSQMITLARQNQSAVFEHDNQSVDGEGAARLLQQQFSSRTTPSGSRRFRRVFSDNDSDGFDSVYGETESNVSFRRSRAFRGEVDAISYSVYEGDSDTSIDGQSILGNDNFGNPNGGSDLETDTDIDPMNAGLYHWSSENEEEEEVGEDDSEWEEVDAGRNPLESMRSVAHFQGLSRLNTRNVHINGRTQSLSPDIEVAFSFGTRERMQTRIDDLSTGIGESVAWNHAGDSVDYLDARGFENLLEHLAEAENSRRRAPAASVSFVNNLPCLTIDEDRLDGTACAICKDSFIVGTVVKKLPCCHLYHPSCIYPWLSARNTCPLCRYQLPTDDSDYEASKRNAGTEYMTLDIHQHNVHYHSSSLHAAHDADVDEPSQLHHGLEQSELVSADPVDDSGSRDIPRNGWFFAAAAAPIVGILGMSLMLWFRTSGRYQRSHIPCRRECGQRRWWWLYF